MTRRVPALFALSAWVVPAGLAAQNTCGDRAWRSIGVEAYHCPGGTCRFIVPRGPESAGFAFSTEPRLRAIDPDGPAAGRIDEGDALVAVNGFLITTAAGAAELAHLDAGRDAVLTVRRGIRVVDVPVRPVSTCGTPLMLTGTSVLETRDGEPATRDGTDPIIDFTVPRRLSETAIDASLGMTVRCTGCELFVRGSEARWTVPSWPVVERVQSGGVADEAGLRAGDEIRRVGRRDVRATSGNSPLFALPSGDFTIEYVRHGARRSAFMNRRIQDIRVVIRERGVRIERSGPAWRARLLGALARWWKSLTDAGETGLPSGRIVVRGDAWGPAGFGVLFRAQHQPLFVTEAVNGHQVLRFPHRPIVADVASGGPAARAGLEPGDVISHVNDLSVLEPEAARLLLVPSGRLALTYLRAGTVRHATLIPQEER